MYVCGGVGNMCVAWFGFSWSRWVRLRCVVALLGDRGPAAGRCKLSVGGYFLKRVGAALERGAALSMNRCRLRQHTFLFCHAAGSVVGTPRALLGQPVLYFCSRFCGYISLFPVRRSLFLGRRVLVVVRWLVGNTFEFCPCTDVVWLFGPQNVNVCRPACLASTPCGAEGAVFE